MMQDGAARCGHWCARCLDFHAHFMHPEVYEICAPHSVSTNFGAAPLPPEYPALHKLVDPQAQIDDMDARGIDTHVISSCDVIVSRAWAELHEEVRLTRMVNDMAADWMARFPRRFIGSCVLPMGDMNETLAELERCVAMNLNVVNLSSNFRGSYLGEPCHAELWSEIHRRNLVVFIHPDGVRDPWFQQYSLWNSIGQSIEEVKVMSTLIYAGVIDRHRGLKVVMAHGGGYMPHYMGRLDRNVTDKPFTAKNLTKMPSEYLRDFHYDSCVYDARTLQALVDRVGADRVVLGGDYPVAALDPIEFLAGIESLTDEQRLAIASGNAIRLLNL